MSKTSGSNGRTSQHLEKENTKESEKTEETEEEEDEDVLKFIVLIK